MKKATLVFALVCLVTLAACTLPTSTTDTPSPVSEKRCGDSVCDGPENEGNCPQDCEAAAPVTPLPPVNGAAPADDVLPAGQPNTYWVTNPTSGARLYVQAIYPTGEAEHALPTLILVPGGIGTMDASKEQRLADEGFAVVIFDPDGRGQSEGEEDYDGFVQQDGLAAVARAAATLPNVDAGRIGLVSFSYGVTMSTGALSRYPDLPIRFYIDWEGPVNRFYTTVGCKPNSTGGIPWLPCDDDGWWAEREALTFIGSIGVPYQRLQSQRDHVQPNNNHAIEIVNAAVAGNVPWVRLNDYPPDQTYDMDDPPAMYPDSEDRDLESLIGRHALEILDSVLPNLE